MSYAAGQPFRPRQQERRTPVAGRVARTAFPPAAPVRHAGRHPAGRRRLLWLIFAFTGNPPKDRRRQARRHPGAVTNIGVMPPGGSRSTRWTSGSARPAASSPSTRTSARSRDGSTRTAQAFEAKHDAALRGPGAAADLGPAAAARPRRRPPATATRRPPCRRRPACPRPAAFQRVAAGGDAQRCPRDSPTPGSSMPLAAPRRDHAHHPRGPIPHRHRRAGREHRCQCGPASGGTSQAGSPTVSTFLPVSFTRGTLLGGLDAPTGGQSQSNPHPVLIRLSDNSVLPNRFRGEYRECFVIAAGYGDISSERAYLRTENLSCVRADGATLEVKIQGSVYGEDGKVGMRGRLVTKQGQMLANALLAGVVSGIGQGLATSSTEATAPRRSGPSPAPPAPTPTARASARRRQGAGPAGPVLHQARREHLPGHRGRCRPRDRRGDHQGRAHRRPDGGRPVFRAPRPLPAPPKPATLEASDDGNY
jgi:conjugal transfer pilus assembly protein TraB